MIRIGTRESKLALWQALLVQTKLSHLSIASEIVPIKSDGDLKLDQPLYEMGITGIFTKSLDLALLNNQIDIAVHSLKDVPTAYPKGIIPVAFLERENPFDVLVYKEQFNNKNAKTIATGSLRRKAFWLNKFPNDKVVDLRGNVQTRLEKLKTSETIDAVIFAYAGLKRCEMFDEIKSFGLKTEELQWMIPAPAQGTIVVTTLEKNQELIKSLEKLNHTQTEIEVTVERDFLKTVEGGCTAPIGAFAFVNNDSIDLRISVLNITGTKKIEISFNEAVDNFKTFGEKSGNNCLQNGGKEIIHEIKQFLNGK